MVSLLRECHLSKCHTRLCAMAWGQAGHDGSATWDSKQMIEDCFSGLDSSQEVQGNNWGPDHIFRWTSCSPQRALNCGSGTGQSNHEEEKVQVWDLALWEGGVTSAERRNAPRSDPASHSLIPKGAITYSPAAACLSQHFLQGLIVGLIIFMFILDLKNTR